MKTTGILTMNTKTIILTALVVCAATLPGCRMAETASPLPGASTAAEAAVPVEIRIGGLEPTTSRALSDDSTIKSVIIEAVGSSGAALGSGTLTLIAGVWQGTLNINDTGIVTFRAGALATGYLETWYGEAQTTITGENDSVSIPVEQLSTPRAVVVFDGNGATSGFAPTNIGAEPNGTKVTAPGNTGGLKKTGYVFTGWSSSTTKGSQTCYPVDSPIPLSASGTVGKKLYAIWVDLKVTGTKVTGTFSGSFTLELMIPPGITEIGEGAFAGYTAISKVYLPASLKTIGKSAFASCEKLTSITIPPSVTSIGLAAFERCYLLASVDLTLSSAPLDPDTFYICDKLTSFTADAANPAYSSIDGILYDKAARTLIMAGRGLTTAKAAAGTTAIAAGALKNCRFLTSFDFPAGLQSIGDSAFYGTKLSTAAIPETVTTIGKAAFQSNMSLTSATLPPGLTVVSDNLFYECRALSALTIPANVTAIGNSAFYNCPINTPIPAGVRSIGFSAFYSTALTSAVIPAGVTAIASSTFGYCQGLKSVTIPDTVTSIGIGAFSDCKVLPSIAIPESVTSIGERAFSGCTALATAPLPSRLVSLGKQAFAQCSSLTSVTIPSGVTVLPASVFYYCAELSSVTIPEGVTTIGEAAFQNCRNKLENITLPSTVTSIEANAFYYCSVLKNLTVLAPEPPVLVYYSLSGILSPTAIHVPEGSLGKYQAANYWKTLASIIVAP